MAPNLEDNCQKRVTIAWWHEKVSRKLWVKVFGDEIKTEKTVFAEFHTVGPYFELTFAIYVKRYGLTVCMIIVDFKQTNANQRAMVKYVLNCQ